MEVMDELEEKLYYHDDDALSKMVKKHDDPVGMDKVAFSLDLDHGNSEDADSADYDRPESHYFYQRHVIHKNKAQREQKTMKPGAVAEAKAASTFMLMTPRAWPPSPSPTKKASDAKMARRLLVTAITLCPLQRFHTNGASLLAVEAAVTEVGITNKDGAARVTKKQITSFIDEKGQKTQKKNTHNRKAPSAEKEKTASDSETKDRVPGTRAVDTGHRNENEQHGATASAAIVSEKVMSLFEKSFTSEKKQTKAQKKDGRSYYIRGAGRDVGVEYKEGDSEASSSSAMEEKTDSEPAAKDMLSPESRAMSSAVVEMSPAQPGCCGLDGLLKFLKQQQRVCLGAGIVGAVIGLVLSPKSPLREEAPEIGIGVALALTLVFFFVGFVVGVIVAAICSILYFVFVKVDVFRIFSTA